MYFEIALALHQTVEEVLTKMSSEEITEWSIFLAMKREEENDQLDKARQ